MAQNHGRVPIVPIGPMPKSTKPREGTKAAPPVNHSRGWRDRATGFHSNDIESEFSRLKRAVRERYGRLSFQSQGQEDDTAEAIDAGDLFEYAFKVNVGDSFCDCLKALQVRSPC